MFSAITNRKPLRRLSLFIPVILGAVILPVMDAQAVPSMARQTGMECSGCHTVFPELTGQDINRMDELV